jgi:hypothetical protein
MPPVTPPSIAERLRHALGRTDRVEIGAPLPAHADPLFAWRVRQAAAGNAELNGELELLGDAERQLLEQIAEQPDHASTLVEEWRQTLAPDEQRAVADLLASVAYGPDPTAVGTMADVGRLVGDVKWLCPNWVPYGMLTEVFGSPGVGKSALVLGAFVKPVITGAGWFSGAGGLDRWCPVIWADTESAMALTYERINKWGLPAERILVPFADDILRPLNLEDAGHLARLHTLINAHRPHLLVVDSLRGAHKRDENCSRMAQVLAPLADLVQRTRIACIVIHHARKANPEADITADDARGSNAITALTRNQIGLDKPDAKSEWVRFRVLKENLGRMPPATGYRWGDHGLEFGPAPERPRSQTTAGIVEAWLRSKLAGGQWVPSQTILDEAEQMGYSRSTLARAQAALGIQKPDGIPKEGNEWQWRLPPAPAGAP